MKPALQTLALLTTLFTLTTPGLRAEEAKPVDTTPKLAYGLLMKQSDKIVFAPCRDKSYAIVDDISPEQSVTASLKSLGMEGGKKFYVEVLGYVEGISLKVSGLNFARVDGRCQKPGGDDEAWRASGYEPGWALAAGGEQVSIKLQDKSDIHFPYSRFKREGKVARFEAGEGKNKLSLQFDQQVCRDAKSETLFGWTAHLTLNGQTLKGCAWQR